MYDITIDQTRRRPAWHSGQHYQSIRIQRLPSPGFEDKAGHQGTARETLQRPRGETVLPQTPRLHAEWTRRVHGVERQGGREHGSENARGDQSARTRELTRELVVLGIPQYMYYSAPYDSE